MARTFLQLSKEVLIKHYTCWMNPRLLPAALLAEPPIAKAVARVILGRPMPAAVNPPTFTSGAHGRDFDLLKFEMFLRNPPTLPNDPPAVATCPTFIPLPQAGETYGGLGLLPMCPITATCLGLLDGTVDTVPPKAKV